MVKLLRGKGADLGLVDPDLGTPPHDGLLLESPTTGTTRRRNDMILYLLEECNADVRITGRSQRDGPSTKPVSSASPMSFEPSLTKGQIQTRPTPLADGRSTCCSPNAGYPHTSPGCQVRTSRSGTSWAGTNALHVAVNGRRVDLAQKVVSLLGEDSIPQRRR